jgi:hypothetical protein
MSGPISLLSLHDSMMLLGKTLRNINVKYVKICNAIPIQHYTFTQGIQHE